MEMYGNAIRDRVLETVDQGRRRLVKGMVGLAGAGFAGSLLSVVSAYLPDVKTFSDITYEGVEIIHTQGDKKGDPVTVDDLKVGQEHAALGALGSVKGEEVWVAKLDPGKLTSDTRSYFSESAEQGVVAYSAICTHLGCAYGADVSEGCAKSGFCPCHNSQFDFCDMARVAGGPAPRPVPALEVKVDGDGKVVGAGSFDGPIGPGKRPPEEA